MSSCSAPGCKMSVPAALENEKLCILHFTMEIERRCAEMRRETAIGRTARDRQVEIITYIGGRGELLARTATSGLHLPDELKGAHSKYFPYTHEPARKSRSRCPPASHRSHRKPLNFPLNR